MNRLFITGDVHGNPIDRFGYKHFPEGRNLDKSDVVIVAGDMGIYFVDSLAERKYRQYALDFLDEKPYTIAFVGGNHENWDILRSLPLTEKFEFGTSVAQCSKSVFFIPNGTLLHLGGRKIWCMGGATSTDINWRLEHQRKHREKIWWENEVATKEEMQRGIDLLESVNNEVDYIITHTMPYECVAEYAMKYYRHMERVTDPMSRYFNFISDELKPKYKEWFCGHFHTNEKFSRNVNCLFEKIVEVE